ncbi:putative brca1-associated protein [Cyclospora cayetanensis]|uniref:Brca1-associated protein n=1 Tax=Cyclospora cayetanensis TaxID=88456 RepID=A0A1D3D1K3_9EIME|nr:putative brca1-associated protein [Cyclospora cayetanensis]
MPLAVLCGHSFHVSCLRKWRDVSCPVCRYQQHPLQPSCCSVCGETEGIMVCLVCGFSGCGGPQRGASQTPSPVGDTVPVFQEAANAGASAAVHGEGGPQRELRKTCHAFSHFLEMSHAHALESASNRVYDFELGYFVDSLIPKGEKTKVLQELAAGIVEANPQCEALRAPSDSGAIPPVTSEGPPTKGGWVSEFNQLLAASLESQELYYKKKIKETERNLSVPIEVWKPQFDGGEWKETVAALEAKLQLSRSDTSSLESEEWRLKEQQRRLRERLPSLRRNYDSLCKEAAEHRESQRSQEETEAARIAALQSRIAELKQEEQDLTFHLSAARRLAGSQDIREGLMLIGQRDGGSRTYRSRRGRQS